MFIEHILCACMLPDESALPSEVNVIVTLTGEDYELNGP